MELLLVDDHTLFREGLALVLKNLDDNITIYEAGDGDSAVAILSDHPDVDLVLLDLQLPGVNDFSLLKTLKQTWPLVPIAILSANENPNLIQQALALGANGFVTKSSNSKIMLRAIQLILDGDIYIPKAILNTPGNGPAMPSISPPPPSTEPKQPPQADIRLTERQQAVLQLMADGLSNKEIAKALGTSPSTVKVHVAAILRVLDVSNRTHAVAAAKGLGLVR